MSWFWLAVATTFSWGCADLFYKIGADENDRYSHLKTTVFVGIVFGLHAAYTLLFDHISFDWRNLWYYAPVSFMYIGSMLLGYLGLRYLELSISSPVQNCSGALACILGIVVLKEMPESALTWVGIVSCCIGVIMLGVFEKKKRDADQMLEESERKYHLGFLAFLLPVGYCVIDTLGTFLDDPCLSIDTTWLVGVTEDNIEAVGNTAYELTFFVVGMVLLVYILIKNKNLGRFKHRNFEDERITSIQKIPPCAARFLAAVFETVGQLAYVHVIGGNAVVAAPMIASYCMVSVVLSRVFLKERLPIQQYVCVAIAFVGIVLLGISDGMA